MNRIWRKATITLGVGFLTIGAVGGYGYLKTTPLKGQLTDPEIWDKALFGIDEEMEDFRVLYAIEEENDISQVVARGDIAKSILPAGEIETFDLSFMEKEGIVSKNTNGSGGTSQNYNYNSGGSGVVSKVPQVPRRQYSAPAGNWCTYQGSALIKAFYAGDFPSKYQGQCRTVYNNAIKGNQGTVEFANEADMNKVSKIFQLKYGIGMAMYAELSGGRMRGYFMGLQDNRVNSASYAEKVVKQLFPNGATANQVVWDCCNWLMRNVRYNAGSPSSDVLFTKGYGNCNAFASALKQMCNAMGVQCDIVAGTAYGSNGWGGHAWNVVYINGVAYNVDACFYATSGGNRSYVLSPNMWSDHRNGVVNNGYINS